MPAGQMFREDTTIEINLQQLPWCGACAVDLLQRAVGRGQRRKHPRRGAATRRRKILLSFFLYFLRKITRVYRRCFGETEPPTISINCKLHGTYCLVQHPLQCNIEIVFLNIARQVALCNSEMNVELSRDRSTVSKCIRHCVESSTLS